MQPRLSIIVPVLNEAGQIVAALRALSDLRGECQLLVADGGSGDGGPALAAPLADKVLDCPRGRARQMNRGAVEAEGDAFLFLHIDTRLPDGAAMLIQRALASGYRWGRFDVRFDDDRPIFQLIAFMMNWRSRLTGIATGDQSLFVDRAAFAAVGGYPDIPLMEDVAISAALKKLGRPCCLHAKVITSARRWRQNGIFSTILLMWRLRLAYFFGADPARLAMRYYRKS